MSIDNQFLIYLISIKISIIELLYLSFSILILRAILIGR